MRIGRYRIYLGRYFRFQSQSPFIIRRILCFTIIRVIDLEAVTKRKKFPLGAELKHQGRQYRYMRKV